MTVALIMTLAVIISVLGFIATIVATSKSKVLDYYAIFIMGVLWVAAGSFFMIIGKFTLNALYALGLIFSVAGLIHRKDWAKHKARWHHLTDKEKKVRMVIVIAVGILILIGIMFHLIMKSYFGG